MSHRGTTQRHKNMWGKRRRKRQRKRKRSGLQRNQRMRRMLLQAANRVLWATLHSSLLISLKLNPLQNRILLPRVPQCHPPHPHVLSPLQPLCWRPQPPLWSPWRPDVRLTSRFVSVVCLLHIQVVIIETTWLPFCHLSIQIPGSAVGD